MLHIFFCMTDLCNTKTKSKLNKCETESYLIYGDKIGKMKKTKTKQKQKQKTSIYMYT